MLRLCRLTTDATAAVEVAAEAAGRAEEEGRDRGEDRGEAEDNRGTTDSGATAECPPLNFNLLFYLIKR